MNLPIIDPAHPLAPLAVASAQVLAALGQELLGSNPDPQLTRRNCQNMGREYPPFFSALAASAHDVAQECKAAPCEHPDDPDALREFRAGAAVSEGNRKASRRLRDLGATVATALLAEDGKALPSLKREAPRLAHEIERLREHATAESPPGAN
jgi:hypothetical protein